MPSTMAPTTKDTNPSRVKALFTAIPPLSFVTFLGRGQNRIILSGRSGQQQSKWPVPDDCAATHHTPEARLVEAGGAVQRAAVVPYDALARGPAVGIDASLRRDRLVKFLDQRAAFRIAHAFDRLGVIAEENSFASCIRVCAHDWVGNRWHLGLLLRC